MPNNTGSIPQLDRSEVMMCVPFRLEMAALVFSYQLQNRSLAYPLLHPMV